MFFIYNNQININTYVYLYFFLYLVEISFFLKKFFYHY